MEQGPPQGGPVTPTAAETSPASFEAPGRHKSEAENGARNSYDPSTQDPHDGLVNQMFGVSLDLHSALTRIQDRAAAEKVAGAIRDIDDVIANMRQLVVDQRDITSRYSPS